MYAPRSPYTDQKYSSLNNSIIQTTPTHNRTQSNIKFFVPPLHQLQRQKVPSQKKLTITCQTTLPTNRAFFPEGESHLRKRGGDYREMKAKFTSLQVSQVRDSQPTTYRQNAEQSQLEDIKKIFTDKFRQLQNAHFGSLKQYENQIKILQLKLIDNARQLQSNIKKIEILQSACNKYKQKYQKAHQQSYNLNSLNAKISDLEAKLRIIILHTEEMKEEQDQSLENITKNLISSLGKRISNIKNQADNFMKISFTSIKKLEETIQNLRQKNDKLSEGTRGSMQIVGSQPKKTNPSFYSEDQCGVSFWDDCFFIPQQSQTSQNYDLIVEMAKRRQQTLKCWIDEFQFLRYSDSNSYIFNRKGDKIHLSKQQIKDLVRQKMLVIL